MPIKDYDFWPEVDRRELNGRNVFIQWDINTHHDWAMLKITNMSRQEDMLNAVRIENLLQWIEQKTNFQVYRDPEVKDYVRVTAKDIELYPETFAELKTRLYHLNWQD